MLTPLERLSQATELAHEFVDASSGVTRVDRAALSMLNPVKALDTLALRILGHAHAKLQEEASSRT